MGGRAGEDQCLNTGVRRLNNQSDPARERRSRKKRAKKRDGDWAGGGRRYKAAEQRLVRMGRLQPGSGQRLSVDLLSAGSSVNVRGRSACGCEELTLLALHRLAANRLCAYASSNWLSPRPRARL